MTDADAYEPLRVRFLGRDETPAPGLIAEVDQGVKQLEITVNTLLSRHISAILAMSEGDQGAAERSMTDAMRLSVELERGPALSALNTLAARVADAWIDEHGGPAAVLARLASGAGTCCETHGSTEQIGPLDPFN